MSKQVGIAYRRLHCTALHAPKGTYVRPSVRTSVAVDSMGCTPDGGRRAARLERPRRRRRRGVPVAGPPSNIIHRATCSMQHATCSMQHATCSMQHVTTAAQHAPCNNEVILQVLQCVLRAPYAIYILTCRRLWSVSVLTRQRLSVATQSAAVGRVRCAARASLGRPQPAAAGQDRHAPPRQLRRVSTSARLSILFGCFGVVSNPFIPQCHSDVVRPTNSICRTNVARGTLHLV